MYILSLTGLRRKRSYLLKGILLLLLFSLLISILTANRDVPAESQIPVTEIYLPADDAAAERMQLLLEG